MLHEHNSDTEVHQFPINTKQVIRHQQLYCSNWMCRASLCGGYTVLLMKIFLEMDAGVWLMAAILVAMPTLETALCY